MKKRYFMSVVLVGILFLACSRRTSEDAHKEITPDISLNKSSVGSQDTVQASQYKDKILRFVKNEIQDMSDSEKTYTNTQDIKAIYGKDYIESVKDIKPFNFEGGAIVQLLTIKYEDLEHIFYVFQDGKQLYAFLIINHALDRLTTINIGSSRDNVITEFGNDFYSCEDKKILSYYFGYGELQFHFQDDKVDQINISYLLI